MIHEVPLGFEYRTDNLLVFFGNSSANLEALKDHYHNLDFIRVKQIHSDAVVESKSRNSDLQVLADSHWTSKKNLALCVITADCVPVLIYDHNGQIIAGVHAGWRGVSGQILAKTVQSFVKQECVSRELQVWIGPHIQCSSFEVGLDVRDLILASLGPLSPEEKKNYYQAGLEQNKFYVDLNKVVRLQLQQLNISELNIHSLMLDTYSDSRFHSHRRDKEKAGRQISFICRV